MSLVVHQDPGPPLQPLVGPERRERAQETLCSCARMKYSMAEPTMLTCPNSLWDCAISHAEQEAHGRNYAILNFQISLPHCTIFPIKQGSLTIAKIACIC